MKQLASAAFTALFSLFLLAGLSAQNVLITSINPDGLYVCGEDTVRITLNNTGAATISNLIATVTLPLGIQYVPGTITGATEQNISNLAAPQFSVASLGVGTNQALTLRVLAACDLVSAINMGQLFNNQISATYTGGSDQITTLSYPVETGLAVIVSATPFTVVGEIGQMPQREIVVRNTRLGPIHRLIFTDQHFPGFEGIAPGAVLENNTSPVFFRAEFDAAFFSGFGDGDGIFEYNEEVKIIEKLMITDCGTPSFENPSVIRVGWGCNTEICQYDSTNANLVILPSTQNPALRYIPQYGYPVDYCANEPATNQVTIINDGNVDGSNVFLDFYNGFLDSYTGMDPSSFEYNAGQGWVSLAPSLSSPITLQACNVTYASRVAVYIPVVPANDTVLVRYKYFECYPDCSKDLIPPFLFTFYKKPCPEGATVTDSIGFVIDSANIDIKHLVKFNLGGCMEENEMYNFNLTARSSRFLTDTSFFQFRLVLPQGIYWDDTCTPPTIEGQSPVYNTSTPQPDGSTEIVIAFKLPFSSDSVNMPFCLKYVCTPVLNCQNMDGEVTQGGSTSTVYPKECEFACGLQVKSQLSISFTPDAAAGCGLSFCHDFKLFVNAENCGGDGGGGGGGGPLFGAAVIDYKTFRTNYGWKDSDDDRMADALTPATFSQIRSDRYMSNDTLQYHLKGYMVLGNIGDIPFRVLTESLQSDFGVADGDAFNLLPARTRFANMDSLKFVRAFIRVKRADGVTYACDAPIIDFKNQNLVNIQQPNVQPPPIIDRFVTMYREFRLNFQTCSPDGQLLGVGDSLEFIYEYTFRNNFAVAAQGGAPPALVNFRNMPWTGDYAWTLPDLVGIPRPLSQYSGFIQTRSFPKHTIRPCLLSLEQIPFQYSLRIARPNMFPFEVRQIAELCKFDYRIPADLQLASAVCDLNLQDNVIKSLNVPIPWTVSNDIYSFDYEQDIFADPIDEGFSMNTNYLFEPSCSFTGPDTSRLMIDFCFPENFPTGEKQIFSRTDVTGFLDALPLLNANFGQTILNLSASNFEIDFSLQNLRPAQASNAWMYVEPLNGQLNDVEILYMPSQTAVPGLANLFQLGTINLLGNVPLRLKGSNSNCDALKVRLVFGWDCDPVTSPFFNSCGKDTVILDLRLKNAVLELDIINQPLEVPLCEPSDYFVFEVSNANDGNATVLTPSVKLPQGLTVIPGSAQVLYPSPGGNWVNIPNPQILTGNIYRWDMATFLPALTTGLPGFAMAPENAFRIRFKTIAECGFVANAQPVYGVDGVQPCGTFTNTLRKPDEPIGLEGISPAYGVDISLSPVSTNPVGCGQDIEISAQILLQGTPAASDSIYLTLPVGVTYVAGSYLAVQNAPSGNPQQFGQTLQLPFNAGLSSGSVVKFNFKVKYTSAAGCVDKFIVAQTRQQTSGFCPLINQTCTVYIATGEALLQIPTANPDLKLASFTPGSVGGGGGFTFDAVLENGGNVPAANPVLQIWVDQNGNGIPDGTDQLVQTVNYNQTIAPGANLSQSGNLNVPLENLCKLIAVLPAEENCACGAKYFPINGLIIDQGTYARCAVEAVPIGIDSTAGHLYNWQPAGFLSCQGCSNTVFNPGPGVMNGDIFIFVLFETAGTCTLEHRFEIRFGELLGISTPDQTICRGDTVRIDASPGGSYQWTGPGVIANAQTQFLSPTSTSTYAVTVTLSAGCTGTDMITVNVLEPSSLDLGVVKTCPGIPKIIFGEPKVDAGQYCKTFPKANGCDSTVCIILQVVPVAGVSTINACEGDTVEVFSNQLESVSGQYCKTFTNSAGCDSSHCVTLNIVPKVTVNPVNAVTIVAETSVQLNGPAGFASYTWTPAAGLSCTDCQSPVATPDITTNYILKVKNAAGCEGEVVYRVVVFPPCFVNIRVPNAFSPNGDQTNDSFSLIKIGEGGFEKAVRLQVYNRWGQRIYDSTTNPTWDGMVDGKQAPVDVYIFILDVECNGETRRLEQREVTLLR